MNTFFRQVKGGGDLPHRASAGSIALAGLGGFLAIASLAALSQAGSLMFVLGSFGASCVLIFGFPESPFSQPRNIVGGHFLSSLIGLTMLATLGAHWWSTGLAVGLAIALMMATQTVHPPAGSNPVIVMLALPGWDFLLTPTLAGAVLLTMAGVLFHGALCKKSYPAYWIGKPAAVKQR
jgi:CBS-domain-containing membrane protein